MLERHISEINLIAGKNGFLIQATYSQRSLQFRIIVLRQIFYDQRVSVPIPHPSSPCDLNQRMRSNQVVGNRSLAGVLLLENVNLKGSVSFFAQSSPMVKCHLLNESTTSPKTLLPLCRALYCTMCTLRISQVDSVPRNCVTRSSRGILAVIRAIGVASPTRTST